MLPSDNRLVSIKAGYSPTLIVHVFSERILSPPVLHIQPELGLRTLPGIRNECAREASTLSRFRPGNRSLLNYVQSPLFTVLIFQLFRVYAHRRLHIHSTACCFCLGPQVSFVQKKHDDGNIVFDVVIIVYYFYCCCDTPPPRNSFSPR